SEAVIQDGVELTAPLTTNMASFIAYRVFAFFFQAEDGIRGFHVTGVQTCALPISSWPPPPLAEPPCGPASRRPIASGAWAYSPWLPAHGFSSYPQARGRVNSLPPAARACFRRSDPVFRPPGVR